MSILIDAETTFIVQGITGREAVNLTRECLDYGVGAKVIGGVTPGRLGREVHGVPVFDTVEQAVAHHGGAINGSVVTVPPAFTKDAVFEAVENGIELGYDPAEKIAIFRIPGAWEEEGFKILERYGVNYVDRSVSLHEAAKRAVETIPA